MNLCNEAEAVYTLRRATGGLRSLLVGKCVACEHPVGHRLEPRDYVLFVHGFRNSHKEARTSYACFRGLFADLNVNAQFVELHWPGDSVNGLAWASYWRHPDTAAKCGALLAEWIKKAPNGARFILVGHSLGCRLILEAFRNMKVSERRRLISGVCLMAAAVPVNMVKNEDLGPLKRDHTEWTILYSGQDITLRLAFYLGQVAAIDSLYSPSVGSTGEPKSLWTRVGSCEEMFQEPEYGGRFYDHGWYWPGGSTIIKPEGADSTEPLPPIQRPRWNGGESAKALARLMGVVIPRKIRSKPQPQGRVVAQSRKFRSRVSGET